MTTSWEDIDGAIRDLRMTHKSTTTLFTEAASIPQDRINKIPISRTSLKKLHQPLHKQNKTRLQPASNDGSTAMSTGR